MSEFSLSYELNFRDTKLSIRCLNEFEYGFFLLHPVGKTTLNDDNHNDGRNTCPLGISGNDPQTAGLIHKWTTTTITALEVCVHVKAWEFPIVYTMAAIFEEPSGVGLYSNKSRTTG